MNPALMLLLRGAAASGGTLAATYRSQQSTGADGISFTVTGAALGDAAADRTVIVVVSWTGATTGISVTLGGSAMTIDRADVPIGANDPAVAIARLAYPAGTAADIVASWSGGTAARSTIGWFTIQGGTVAVASTAEGTASMDVTVPTGGVAIVGGEFGVVGTWSGFTPDYTAVQESTWRGVGGSLAASATVTNTGATFPLLAAVAYQPA